MCTQPGQEGCSRSPVQCYGISDCNVSSTVAKRAVANTAAIEGICLEDLAWTAL